MPTNSPLGEYAWRRVVMREEKVLAAFLTPKKWAGPWAPANLAGEMGFPPRAWLVTFAKANAAQLRVFWAGAGPRYVSNDCSAYS